MKFYTVNEIHEWGKRGMRFEFGGSNVEPCYLSEPESCSVLSVDELRKLQQQIEVAIGIIELNHLIPLTEQEKIDHVYQFGKEAFVVGDFVIKRR